MTLPFHYRLFGLDVGSELDLGDLPRGGAGEAQVAITRGAAPPISGEAGRWFEATPDGMLIDMAPVARFKVSGGRSIVVEGGADRTAALRWRVLGTAFGALLQQRDILALHTTVVSIGGRAVGLTGPSGAGKSTLAAFLVRRGHRLLIDDVCATVVADGVALVEPGYGRLRLWRDALEALGDEGGEQLVPDLEKFELSAEAPGDERLALGALVDLRPGQALSIAPLDLAERLGLCLRNTYCRAFLPGQARATSNFAQCVRVAETVPAWRLERPLDFAGMDAAMALLEDTVAGLAE